VAAVSHLSRRFGAKKALSDVSLSVPRGAVFGLVGENGAGKSTLIKHLLGLWRAQTGTVRLFGLDPVSDPVAVLGRIGYLSEEPDLPGWMRVGELLRYTQAFYPRWDATYAEHLRDQFGLHPDARIKTVSKGQRARLGLIAAEAHRPDLLILDEPSSGLDPIVRRDILEAIIRTVTDQGRTVLFSSHLLDEVERVSDYLAMLHRGALIDAVSPEAVSFTTESIRMLRMNSRREIETESGEYRRWLDGIPGSRLVVTNRSGHNVAQEQPELVVATIRDAVDEVTRRRQR
jgi:ABC-2 type transport system ATP-binding protein